MGFEHRGFMLDTARKFFPVETIYNLLDMLARNNFNVFHWHIYDDESFPLSWSYENASILGKEFYTTKDIMSVVEYATQRNIRVIPEFEMPAHCGSLASGFNHILCENELNLSLKDTYKIVSHFLIDMMNIFPDKNVHFGGDEIAGTWPDTDHRKTIENFENTFVLNLSKAFNKKPIIWEDPITEKKASISREFVIQVWRNKSNLSLVLNKGFQTIVSTSDTWYVGNATPEKISAFVFPYNSLVKGAELVWFTSQGDDPYDISWLEPVIKAAGKKLI